MSWIVRLLSKAGKFDAADVMNQQFADDILRIFTEFWS
jgi:hypothetical protein